MLSARSLDHCISYTVNRRCCSFHRTGLDDIQSSTWHSRFQFLVPDFGRFDPSHRRCCCGNTTLAEVLSEQGVGVGLDLVVHRIVGRYRFSGIICLPTNRMEFICCLSGVSSSGIHHCPAHVRHSEEHKTRVGRHNLQQINRKCCRSLAAALTDSQLPSYTARRI